SRCQVFEFKRPTVEVLKDTVSAIAKKEGFSIEPAAAELVALVCDGSFRDSHGILERVIAGVKGKKISRDDVEEATGSPKSELVREFVGAIALRDGARAFNALSRVRKQSFDPKLFLELSLSLIRRALLKKMGAAGEAAEASEEDR